jgi:hypothetical protein
MGKKKYTDETEREIARKYVEEGVAAEELIRTYGFRTPKSITDKVKKYFPDYDFKDRRAAATSYYGLSFKTIDSPEKAYFLGLLLTDGYVGSKRNQVGLDLLDRDCLDFLAELYNFRVAEYARPPHEPKYRITFDGRQYVEQLARFGVVPRKSLILGEPDLRRDERIWIPYIIRGIIDGDGSVFLKNGLPVVSICSASRPFMEWIRKELKETLFFESNLMIYSKDNHGKPIYSIEIARREDVERLKALCYSRPMGMQRKRNKLFE